MTAIGGNALADLAGGRADPRFRPHRPPPRPFRPTPQVEARQERGVTAAETVLCVSQEGCEDVRRLFGIAAGRVANGVDTATFSPGAAPSDPAVRTAHGLGTGPVILSVGGLEARKNSLRIIEAFAQLRARHPTAQLLIVGGRVGARPRGLRAAVRRRAPPSRPRDRPGRARRRHRSGPAGPHAGALSRGRRPGLSLARRRVRARGDRGHGLRHARDRVADRALHRISRARGCALGRADRCRLDRGRDGGEPRLLPPRGLCRARFRGRGAVRLGEFRPHPISATMPPTSPA